MLMQQTLLTLKSLRLPGMAAAFEEQQRHAQVAALAFDERFAMLVDREHAYRENRRIARLLREARLKSSQACIEDIRYGTGRNLDRVLMAQLASCQWIRAHQNLILTGAPLVAGKPGSPVRWGMPPAGRDCPFSTGVCPAFSRSCVSLVATEASADISRLWQRSIY